MTDTPFAPEAATENQLAPEVTDKRRYGERWLFSPRHVDNLIAQGLPHLKIGSRRVRIVVAEADRWMIERFGVQHRAATKSKKASAA